MKWTAYKDERVYKSADNIRILKLLTKGEDVIIRRTDNEQPNGRGSK